MAIVDSEINNNWYWFMDHLKAIVVEDKIYTFISDRHSELLKSISTVFSDSYHSYYFWHLKLSLTVVISSKDC